MARGVVSHILMVAVPAGTPPAAGMATLGMRRVVAEAGGFPV
jgi:hypothetical protein